MLLTSPVLLALPVVDVDGTLFVQGGLFLLMMFLLNGLLFKPWLEVQARRTDNIAGAIDKAQRMEIEAAQLGTDYDKKLRAAREKAQEVRSDIRKESEAKQAERVAEARADARQSLDAARTEIGREADQARSALSGRVDQLAKDIVSKILGRAA